MRVRLEVPGRFSFRRTILAHGWYQLPPFAITGRADGLATVVALPEGGARRIELSAAGRGVALESPGVVSPATRRALVAAARRMLAFDVDLEEFHDTVGRDDRFRWIAETRTGRMLRAPTMFEDVVKLVLTTNCSWAFTTKMAGTLVERYGEPTPDGARSFPTPARLARLDEPAFREVVRAGYRSPYLVALARDVASGRAEVSAWDADPRPAGALRKEMLELPGVGPYVAENLLKFLGRPDGLALDSSIRARYAALYHGGRPVSDRTIARKTASLGRWAGLALWFELSRGWFGE